MKNTWKVINTVLNRGKAANIIPKLEMNDRVIEDNFEIAEIFNSYFSKIGSNLAQTITPGDKSFHDFLTSPNDHSIFFNPTDREELIKIVNQLKRTKLVAMTISTMFLSNIFYSL